MKMKFVLSLMVVAAQIAAAGVVAGEGEVQVVSVAEAATLTESNADGVWPRHALL